MQITLGNVAVAVSVFIGCGTVIRSLGRSLKRGFIMAEEAVCFVRWLKPLMEKYPDSAVVVEKLAKLNGHSKETQIVDSSQTIKTTYK